ncbi:MAG: polysaccharide biosynthesis C-terminal domain-containing protein [Clostridia bacterium]|nr:polysaccharide biosynthesis C-terminal domain-containing protein [Clostridia bacterium]
MRDSAQETRIFSEYPILRSVLTLAIPTVISQIILVIYNMADTFFIGMTGSDAMLTSVTVCMPAFMFLSAISNLFGVGGASVIARSLGAGDMKKARRTSSFAFWGCVGLTLAYSLGALMLIHPFVNALGGADPMVHDNACRYLRWTVIIGGVGTSLNALLGHLVRSEGRSMQAGFGIAMGGVLNIGLDPLFMFVILPRGSEVTGAALATMLSNLTATLYFLTVIWVNRDQSVLSLKPTKRCLDHGIPADVLATGLPACLMTLCENISYAVLDNLMSTFGMMTQAGIGVAKKVNMLAHCMVRGMSQGVLPLIAYNYAARNYKRMKSAVMLSTGISIGLATACMAACLLFSRNLIGVFIQHESPSLDYGAAFLRILCIGGPFSACAYAFISFFQATGESRKSFMLAILRKGLLDIPLMFILIRPLPIYGIVWATPIADTVCCVVAITLFLRFTSRLSHHSGFVEVAA